MNLNELTYSKSVFFNLILILVLIFGASCTDSKTKFVYKSIPEPVAFQSIEVRGDLYHRIDANFKRLEEEKYQPEHVFLTNEESTWWPGDTEGRTVLGLTLDAQVLKRTPQYLDSIVSMFPGKMNAEGFFGDVPPDSIVDEQQLSSHGWVLRGLCEYYLWKKDEKILGILNRIIDHLAMPTYGFYQAKYPTDPSTRNDKGEYAGSRYDRPVNGWVLSTDVGCFVIFLDGLVQAYDVTKRQELVPLLDEMIGLFLSIDLFEIKAQTHATLTGLRALSRYYEISHNAELIPEIEKRFKLYMENGMTENYENYNWFQRPMWTEPCAIIDSYMEAVNLWRYTGKPEYLNVAQLIYYNGIGATQRMNGGFGCNNCTGANTPFLLRKVEEAHWCCTMRGGEGLSRATQNLYFMDGDTIYANFFEKNSAELNLPAGKIEFTEETNYPFDGGMTWTINKNELKNPVIFRIFMPEWAENAMLAFNGTLVDRKPENSFYSLEITPEMKGEISFSFDLKTAKYPVHNSHSIASYFSYHYGPMILAADTRKELFPEKDELPVKVGKTFQLKASELKLEPIFAVDSVMVPINQYAKQVLFKQ